ncbi:hypothetical protein OPV22_022331 [Ensete ventricosum]|uniref:HhH-GPD domain-containing protein n=1 Tax=Ensete ventricosum TaxID=4639 RepID=A0AAV8QP51_ENSVE|nr:hypothetical protein OPV22_022331 [Ensete ventricosum]
MDFNRGVPLWQEEDFEIQSPWAPITPAKPVPVRRTLVPGHGQISHAPPAPTWLDVLNGTDGGGFSQEALFSGSNASGAAGYVGRLQDLNTIDEAAAALAYSGQIHDPYVSNYNLGVGPGMSVFGNLSDGWTQTPHMNLMAFADAAAAAAAAAASKVPFFTPLMLSQIQGGHRMPAPATQLLLNGRVLLDSSLSRCNLSPIVEARNELTMNALPNLNSSWEETISYAPRELMQYPPTPVSLEKNKLVQDGLPLQVIDLVDDGSGGEEAAAARRPQALVAKQVELCFSEDPVAPPSSLTTAMSFEVVLCQQQQPETRAVVTSEEGIDRPLNAEAQGNIENNGIDLNKTPRQKPKRKKHRPKVIREGKPKRTPKPATPKPLNPSGKRKYVRRNKVQVPPSGNPSDEPGEEAATPPGSSDGTKSVRRSVKNTQDNPSGKRKYVRKKKIENSSDDPLSMPGGTADPESRHGTKSVRRCLNFDAEAPKARDGFPESVLMFTNNAGYQAQESCTAGNTINIDVAPSSHYARAVAAADNIAPGYPIVLNSAKDRVTNEYIRFVENPSPNPQHCRRETVRADQILRESRTMPENPTTPPRPHKRENLKKLARKNFLRITSNPDRSQEADINQFDSHETPNSLLRRTQNNHILDPDAPNSTNTKSMHAYDGVEGLGELHGATCNDPYVSQRYKKQRIEHEYGFTSAAALTCMPLNDFRTHQRESNTAEVFTSADPQNFRAPKISEDVPAIYQTTNSAAKRSEPSFEVHSAYSLSSSVNFGHIRKHGNQPGQYAMDHNKLSSSPQPFSGTDGRESQNHEFLTCMQNQVASNKSRTRTKQQRKKEEVQLVNHLINANQVEFQRQVAASCRFKNCPDQKIPEATSLFSQDFRTEVTHTSSGSCLNPGAIVLYGDPLDDIIWKLRHLTINGLCKADTAKTQKAIVPYEGAGVIIPYKGLFDLAKKRRPRPKVDLDPETNRVWNLLMGKEVGDGTERDKEKWWAEERRVFCGRVDSFIARMHLVQGDRRFSRWKGSVVDSVVGVFLTQNVSDHLSSSAFMALAARFPLWSGCHGSETNTKERDTCIKHEGSCIETLDGNTSKWQGQISDKELHDPSSLVIVGDNETANSNESFGSNISGKVADYSKVYLDSKETVIDVSHESPDTESGTPVTLTGSTGVAEAEDRWSVEDAGSSQNSVVSSQNSSENPAQTAYPIGINSLSNVRVENVTIQSVCDNMANSTSFTELLNSVLDVSGNLRDVNSSMSTSITNLQDANLVEASISASLPLPYHFHESSSSGLVAMECVNALSDESIFNQDSNSGTKTTSKFGKMESSSGHSVGNISEVLRQQNLAAIPRSLPTIDIYAPTYRHFIQPSASPKAESFLRKQFCCPSNLQTDINEAPMCESISQKCLLLPDDNTVKFQKEEKRQCEVESTKQAVQFQLQEQNSDNQQNFPNLHNNGNPLEVSERVQLDLKDDVYVSKKISAETPKRKSKEKKLKDENERKKNHDWDSLRKEVNRDGTKKERIHGTMDSVNWEAVRCAEVNEISETIRERGMNNMLAERIKEFLNRLVRDHGSIDLEWLREVEPDKAKNYLLSIRGLGLKSVECVRLLTLQNLAFPVDTNVGRICVRLGWVPLQPLPESLQLHLLELYPILETIQKYLWPRLCKLDQRTLYELHYQMITFGKVFCTKSKPNCNACPMRGECKHFASAYASARLALPGPAEKSLVSSTVPIAYEKDHVPALNPTNIPQLEGISCLQERVVSENCEPIIEEPATPEPECIQTEERAIEDAFYEDPEEIPTIKLNIEEFTQNLHNYMQANNMELQDIDVSKALVAINPEAASIPMPKLKNISRLRTEHHVYELPDSHPLLEGLDPREPDDPSSYLLAIWTPGETAQSTEPPKASCNTLETGVFCNMVTCFTCNSRREAQAQIVRGTILIPCRTAMRGSFPLNGTYFQVNEVFADHDSSRNPIDVPREWIWNLPRRTVYFGTSVPTIFKGLTTEEIQLCFWRGFVCVRGFDRKTRAPRPLYARLHFPASKAPRNKRQEKTSPARRTANNN